LAAKGHSASLAKFIECGPSIGQDSRNQTTMLKKIRYLVVSRFLSRFSERFFEWWYGIETDADIRRSELGLTDPESEHYNATPYIRFRQMMKLIQIRPGEDVFLDFGSGMGRIVVLAATYPFRRVIGIELTEKLHRVAQENVRRASTRLRCRNIELHQMDARSFRVPPDVTVVYFWNPFGGVMLEKVFTNIRESVLASPRTVTIIYLHPSGVTALDKIKPRLPWLKERQRVNFGASSVTVIYTCSVEE
jgi:precorrin-6B methylase 2